MANNAGNINESKGKSWLPKFLADMFDSSAQPAPAVPAGVAPNIARQINNNAPTWLPKMITNVLDDRPRLNPEAAEFRPRQLNPQAPEFVPAQGGRRRRATMRRRKSTRRTRAAPRRSRSSRRASRRS